MRTQLLISLLTTSLVNAIPHRRQESSIAIPTAVATETIPAPQPTANVEDLSHPDTDWKCVRTCEERGAYVIMRSKGNKIQCSGPDGNGCFWFHNPSCDGQVPTDKDAPTYDIGYYCKSYNLDWCGEGLRQFWKGEPQSVCALDKIAPENLSDEEKLQLQSKNATSASLASADVSPSGDEAWIAQSGDVGEEVIPPSDVNHGAPTNVALYYPGAADATDLSSGWLAETNQGSEDVSAEDSAPGEVNAAAYA